MATSSLAQSAFVTACESASIRGSEAARRRPRQYSQAGIKFKTLSLLFAVSFPVIPKSGPVNLRRGTGLKTCVDAGFSCRRRDILGPNSSSSPVFFPDIRFSLPKKTGFAGLRPPPPSLPEPRKPSSIEKRPFRRGSCRLFSTFPGLCRHDGLSGGFFGSGLCIQKFRSWRLDFEARRRPGIGCRKVSFARLRKPIADLIRGFRTVGSTPRERRAAARLRYPGANNSRIILLMSTKCVES